MTGTAVLEQCDDLTSCLQAFWQGLEPPPRETVSQWADAHLHLPSHVAEAGPWRTDRTPFLKEIMDCLSPMHPCHEVVFMKPVQIGGTQAAVNWIGYTMDRSPAAMLLYEPTQDMAKRLTKEKLDPMLAATPSLKGKVKEPRSRDSGNTTFRKEFLGGFLNILHANSSASARSTSAPRIVLDEVDEYQADVGDQGHPCDLIEKRAASYPDWKIFTLSTPTIEGESRIEQQYQRGSRARYFVPCPYCQHLQHLDWDQLIFTFNGEKRPQEAAYQCLACARLIDERHKTWMMDLSRARWIHEDEANERTRSFHLNLLYQPYGWAYPWARLAEERIEAYEKLKSGDHRAMKTFVNTFEAKTWKVTIDTIKQDDLYARREDYAAPCPAGVLVLTAAVDIQGDRLEAEVCGWGLGEESWSLSYRIFYGSPSLPQVWSDLTDWLQQPYAHADGVALRVEAVGIDTGGHHTKEAYAYVEHYRKYRGLAYALKGSSQRNALPIPNQERQKLHRRYRVQVHLIGTDAIKDTLFERMKLTTPGPGYMHHPRHVDYNEKYFEGLASEVKKPHYLGKSHIHDGYIYQKVKQRNEPLDLKVYNQATLLLWLKQYRTTLEKVAKRHQERVTQLTITTEAEISVPVQDHAPELPEKASFVKAFTPPRRRSGGFVKGWR